MLTIDQLNLIEQMMMSRAHSAWGEFAVMAQLIGAVQTHKNELIAAANADPARRTRPSLVPGPNAPPQEKANTRDEQSTAPQSAA